MGRVNHPVATFRRRIAGKRLRGGKENLKRSRYLALTNVAFTDDRLLGDA